MKQITDALKALNDVLAMTDPALNVGVRRSLTNARDSLASVAEVLLEKTTPKAAPPKPKEVLKKQSEEPAKQTTEKLSTKAEDRLKK